MPKLVGSSGFREDVGRLKICAKVDITSHNALSNEVIVHFDRLCRRMEHKVSSQIDTAHVVVEEGSQILDCYLDKGAKGCNGKAS